MLTEKDTNPKDAVGTKKVPASVLPRGVVGEMALALLEGARKYGRHNYRIAGIRASVYYDAAMRHLDAWWEGEDIDPDSGLSHITKALATLCVLRDAMMNSKWTDDRPPSMQPGWVAALNRKAAEIIERYPDAKEPYTREMPSWESIEYETSQAKPSPAKGLTSGTVSPYMKVISIDPDEKLSSAEIGRRVHAALVEMLEGSFESAEPVKPQYVKEKSYLWGERGVHLELNVQSVEDLPSLEHCVETLSRARRWGCHYSEAISIARHCVNVAKLAVWLKGWVYDEKLRGANDLIKACLAHDISEALYLDRPTPLKMLERAMLPEGVRYPHDILVEQFDRCLSEKYELDLDDPLIHKADAIACCIEACERGIPQDELMKGFSEEVLQEAARAHLEGVLPVSQAWTEEDDQAAWWMMWTRAQGQKE